MAKEVGVKPFRRLRVADTKLANDLFDAIFGENRGMQRVSCMAEGNRMLSMLAYFLKKEGVLDCIDDQIVCNTEKMSQLNLHSMAIGSMILNRSDVEGAHKKLFAELDAVIGLGKHLITEPAPIKVAPLVQSATVVIQEKCEQVVRPNSQSGEKLSAHVNAQSEGVDSSTTKVSPVLNVSAEIEQNEAVAVKKATPEIVQKPTPPAVVNPPLDQKKIGGGNAFFSQVVAAERGG